MRLFSQIYFLFFLSYNKESNMYKALMHSVIKSKDQFKKQRNGIKISTKPKSTYGGQQIQCKASDYQMFTLLNIKDVEKIKTKIREKFEYFQKTVIYLYENDMEFLIDVKHVDVELEANGHFICRIIKYDFSKKTQLQGIFIEKEYFVLICGYISKTNDEHDHKANEWVGYKLKKSWPFFKNLQDHVLAMKNSSGSIYTFEPSNSTKVITDKYGKELNSNTNPLGFWKYFLKLIETNIINCSLAHSEKYKNILIFTYDNNQDTLKTLYSHKFKNINVSQISSKEKYPEYCYKDYEIELNNINYYLRYHQKLMEIEKEYFNLCNNSCVNFKTNNKFQFIFNQNNLISKRYDEHNKFINLNKLKQIGMKEDEKKKIEKINQYIKEKTVEIISDFVDEDMDKNNSGKKLMFISHNIQNKNGKETNDEKNVEGVGAVGISNIFRQYSEMLFGQTNQKLNDNYFRFTQSMVILLQETNWLAIDTTIYGQGDVYYVNCDVANGSLFMYGNKIFGYNTFRSLEKIVTDKGNVYKYIDINEIEYDDEEIESNMQNVKTLFDQKQKEYKSKKKQHGGDKRNRGEFEDQDMNINTYINEYIVQVIKDIEDPNIDFKSLKIKYYNFLEYLKSFKKLPKIEQTNKTNKTNKRNKTNKINKTKIESPPENPFLNSIFLHPQFKFSYINFEKNVFKGSIMVHDLTDWFEKGLAAENDQYIFGTVSMNTGQRLFAISCDERMNFTNSFRNIDSRNNKTKQLCTIFSSEFFDPREKQDETHVVLIGIGVAGPTKNHVAMVVANKTFEEVIINVHLESAGQGDKIDSNEYALAELDILLNCILGNNIHPFFEKHNNTIKTIRIFSDFNLLSNVIADRLKKFKIHRKMKDYKFHMLLEGVKTHDNVKKKDTTSSHYSTEDINPKKINSGCIDNVIYITKVQSIEDNIEKCIIGERKLPSETYTKDQYDSLSDHSPMIIIEDIQNTYELNKVNSHHDNSPSVIDNRTKYLLNPHF